jgi:hypothetical protein
MPGTAAHNKTGFISVYALSCGSPGNCTAGGYYETSEPSLAVPYVEDQVNGTWQAVEPVPGVPVAKVWEGGMVISLSCPAAGSCAAGGVCSASNDHTGAFIASEGNGTWDKAEQVPGTYLGHEPEIDAIACPAAGACTAVGSEEGAANGADVFVTRQTLPS